MRKFLFSCGVSIVDSLFLLCWLMSVVLLIGLSVFVLVFMSLIVFVIVFELKVLELLLCVMWIVFRLLGVIVESGI